jgi:acetyl-CoA carboxylase alpha subunit
LHDSQDMVKALKSKMLVSDVMKEQDAQREYRARKNAIQKNIEQNWEELEKQKMEEYDSKMRAKLEREYNKKMENAKAISD